MQLKTRGSWVLSSTIFSLIIHVVLVWFFLHIMLSTAQNLQNNSKPVEVNLVSLAPSPSIPAFQQATKPPEIPKVEYKQQPKLKTEPVEEVLPEKLTEIKPKLNLVKKEPPPNPEIQQYTPQKVTPVKYKPVNTENPAITGDIKVADINPAKKVPQKLTIKKPSVPVVTGKVAAETKAIRYRKPPAIKAKPTVSVQPVSVTLSNAAPFASRYTSAPIKKSTVPAASKGNTGIPPSVLDEYKAMVRQKIEENKLYPLSAMEKGIEGDVWVGFTVARDGKLESVKVVKSSMYRSLDRAALMSIERSNPFPPFPAEIKAKQLNMVVCIRFKLQNQ